MFGKIKLYCDLESYNTILEYWSSSTKHPDIKEYFQDYIDNYTDTIYYEMLDFQGQWYQWILRVASEQMFKIPAHDFVKFANTLYHDLYN